MTKFFAFKAGMVSQAVFGNRDQLAGAAVGVDWSRLSPPSAR
jgi:hypothetical protein